MSLLILICYRYLILHRRYRPFPLTDAPSIRRTLACATSIPGCLSHLSSSVLTPNTSKQSPAPVPSQISPVAEAKSFLVDAHASSAAPMSHSLAEVADSLTHIHPSLHHHSHPNQSSVEESHTYFSSDLQDLLVPSVCVTADYQQVCCQKMGMEVGHHRLDHQGRCRIRSRC